MISCLTFNKEQFPGLDNVRLWLANQTGERRAALGDLAVRGKFSMANQTGRKAWFVCRFSDIIAGTVPKISELGAGEVLEQGVTAWQS
jgi:hypothetical protein